MTNADLLVLVAGFLGLAAILFDAFFISPKHSKSDTWFSFLMTTIYFFAGVAVLSAACVLIKLIYLGLTCLL